MKAVQRIAPKATYAQLIHGIPLFLDQIIKTLRVEQTCEPMLSRKVSGASGGGKSAMSEIGVAARRHGYELLKHGFTVDLVVHEYGDLCQAITDLAFEINVPIEVDEFRTLNRCLDNAIADSVTEFAYERDLLVAARGTEGFHERMGVFSHELRNLIATATQAVAAIRTGQVGLSGPTGAALDRSLSALRTLIDRSLADVQLAAAMPKQQQLIGLADFLADIQLSAALQARAHECTLMVSEVDPRLAVDGDRNLLFSALGNLLQNAFKFTARQTEVSLNVYATGDRILMDVEDHCGGLPPGVAEQLTQALAHNGEEQPEFGRGLSMCRRSVEANNGVLRERNVPGTGCVFTIDLPRHSLAERFFRV